MRGYTTSLLGKLRHHRVASNFVLSFVMVAVTAPLFIFFSIARANDTRVVNIHIDGQSQSFPTDAATVSAALERAEVIMGEHDLVEPGLDTAITTDTFHINVYRARPVVIIDGDERYQVTSAYQSPRLIAEQAGLKVYDEDLFELSRIDNFLSDSTVGLKLHVIRATPLKLNLYGTTSTIRTQAENVSELLAERGISPDSKDVLRPAHDHPIEEDMDVHLIRVSGDREVVEESISFTRREIQDTSQPIGYEKVTTAGRNGRQLVTYDIVIENGREVSRSAVSRVMLSQPVQEIVVIGADYTGTYPNNAAVLSALRQCETHGNYQTNTGNGFYGAYQFMQGTWDATARRMGQTQWVGKLPSSAPASVQDAFVLNNASASLGGFWSQHPGCSKSLNLPKFPY